MKQQNPTPATLNQHLTLRRCVRCVRSYTGTLSLCPNCYFLEQEEEPQDMPSLITQCPNCDSLKVSNCANANFCADCDWTDKKEPELKKESELFDCQDKTCAGVMDKPNGPCPMCKETFAAKTSVRRRRHG